MHNLTVVIPVYRSESILPGLLARLEKVLPAIANNYEVIMVCDGSPDDSWETIKTLAKTYTYLKGINLRKNYGQHNAILVGIREAKYEIIVTMDDDLQHPPEEIHKLLKKLDEGHDVVYGTPEHLQHSALRNASSVVTKFVVQHSMGYENASKINAFRAFRTELREAFSNYRDKFISIDILLTWGTNNFSSVVVQHNERYSGISGYSLRKLLFHAVNLITSFSSLPLQIASIIGFVFMSLGMLILIYILINYINTGGSVPGFTFVSSMIAIFSGVQLFSLGVIGEYLSRIHFRSMGQPYAFIKEKTYDTNSAGKNR